MTVFTALATLWAGLLVVLGMWVMFSLSQRMPLLAPVLQCGGLAAVAGGQFVFMAWVADRLLPGAARRVVGPLEVFSFLVFVGGLIGTVWFLLGPIAAPAGGGGH
ncbi:MAG: hypothetical protein SFY96_07725 [Planctomycetota bacterium]|nr:hypothetical protein [Planctomycetota bacterium]